MSGALSYFYTIARTQWLTIKQWRVRGLVSEESGTTLVESLVAVALLGVVIVALLAALSTGSQAVRLVNQEVTAQSLARSNLEGIKVAPYAATYSTVSEAGYDVSVDVNPVAQNIQKITLTVSRGGATLLMVEDYKVNR